MKIFIDFDDVIFNTKKFSSGLVTLFGCYGITPEEFCNSYYTFPQNDLTKKPYYDPDAQIRRLGQDKKIDTRKLKKGFQKFMTNLGGYVFSDIENFLNAFSKKDLFILSYGQSKFQKKKIKGSGMEKMVGKVIVTRRKKAAVISDLAKKYAFSKKEAIILIDDHPEQLEAAKKTNGQIKAFRLSRKDGRYRKLFCSACDYEKKNLKTAAQLIKQAKSKK